ncbi:MAG: hypothetical protein RMJ56_01770 [Gemmataceae bacterium]|nr:hypothetical protein [Gemmata sp.]MDW8196311.1 hypothetical protein [Gemmataceae bacterium]
MNRLRAVVLLWCVGLASPVGAASPDPKDLIVPPEELSKARELVQKLGSENFREREEAQAGLAKMGRRARQALADAVLNDTDPEIRLRASLLLPKANADDLKARIETFLADTEGKYDHDLPGLKLFRKYLGATQKSRDLYAEILKSPYNMELFNSIEKGEEEGGRAIADRRTTMWNEMNGQNIRFSGRPFTPKQPSLPDIAALLFAESVVPAERIPQMQQWQWINGTQFIHQPASMNALNNPNAAHAEVYRAIIARWLATRTDPNELANLSYQLGQMPLKQFKEALPLLRRIVLTEGVQNYAKGQALNSLVMTRGKDEAKFLRDILRNEIRVGDYPELFPNEKNPDRVITVNNDQMIQQVWFGKPDGQAEMHNCTMKDVALAFLISQSGGNIRDYGFETQPGAVIHPNQLGYGQYAFTSETKRAAGYMKFGWKQLKDQLEGPSTDKPANPPKDETNPSNRPGRRPDIRPVPGIRPAPPVQIQPIQPLPVPPPPAPDR